MIATRGSMKAAADICRANGWQVGDTLRGDDGHSTIEIVITAIGTQKLLARGVNDTSEASWCLMWRDWQKIN